MTNTYFEEPSGYQPGYEEIKLKMAVYSVPGVGKTTLAASSSVVPDMSPVAIISAESGMEAIAEDMPDLIDTSQIKAYDVSGFKDLKTFYEFFAFGKHPYKTIVMDTVDEVLGSCIYRWSRYYVPISEETGLPLNRAEDDKMGLKIYNRVTDEMKELLRKFRNLPFHIIFTAHETETPLVNGGPLRIRMDLTPALYRYAEGAISVIGRMQYKSFPAKPGEEEGDIARIVTFMSPTDMIRVKDRTPGQKLGRVMVNPTMQKIWDRRTSK